MEPLSPVVSQHLPRNVSFVTSSPRSKKKGEESKFEFRIIGIDSDGNDTANDESISLPIITSVIQSEVIQAIAAGESSRSNTQADNHDPGYDTDKELREMPKSTSINQSATFNTESEGNNNNNLQL